MVDERMDALGCTPTRADHARAGDRARAERGGDPAPAIEGSPGCRAPEGVPDGRCAAHAPIAEPTPRCSPRATPRCCSHGSAAALHGLPGFAIEPLVVTTARRWRRPLDAIRVEQSLAFAVHHATVVDGIPCTTVARTLFDLCGDVHPRRAERAIDTALARRAVDFARALADASMSSPSTAEPAPSSCGRSLDGTGAAVRRTGERARGAVHRPRTQVRSARARTSGRPRRRRLVDRSGGLRVPPRSPRRRS